MQTEIELAGWVVAVDVERTRVTYETISLGGWQKCSCAYCRNFGAALDTVFPPNVLDFFSKVGIDPVKSAEVYEYGEVSPGTRAYGGEFYLWGTVAQEPSNEKQETAEFRIRFRQPSPLAQKEFRAEGSLCLRFDTNIPWVLKDE